MPRRRVYRLRFARFRVFALRVLDRVPFRFRVPGAQKQHIFHPRRRREFRGSAQNATRGRITRTQDGASGSSGLGTFQHDTTKITRDGRNSPDWTGDGAGRTAQQKSGYIHLVLFVEPWPRQLDRKLDSYTRQATRQDSSTARSYSTDLDSYSTATRQNPPDSMRRRRQVSSSTARQLDRPRQTSTNLDTILTRGLNEV